MIEQAVGLGYLFVAAIGFAYTYAKSREKAKQAAKGGVKAFGGVALTLVAVFLLVGLLEVYVPAATIERLLGSQAGLMSLLVGASIGSVAAGPPVAAYPIASSLLAGGAWVPAVAAFIVSWTLVGFVSLPFEARLFGARFAIGRNVLSFAFAMVIGVAMGWLL